MLKDVPDNCTVVGVPGRVVKREGRRLGDPSLESQIDLQHNKLPDPVAEMILCMQKKIDRLEERIAQLEVWEDAESIQHAKQN